MTEHYRGHCISLNRSSLWDAIIVQIDSGIVLPTKATALLSEGKSIAIARARQLVDLYMDAGRIENAA